MEQTTNTAAPENAAPENNTQSAAAPMPAPSPDDLHMVGRFSRYTSVFWQIILPFLAVRYLFEGADKLFKFNQLVRSDNGKILGRFEDRGIQRWVTTNIASLGFGTALAAIAAFYTNRTYKDIKRLFSEAVGYELDKPAKDIKFSDLKRSHNVIVKTTIGALINRTVKRFGAISTVFFPWVPVFNHKLYNRDTFGNDFSEVGMKIGAGVVGGYLFMDGFLRKQSLFEAMQDRLGDPNAVITTADIEHFLSLDKKSENKNYILPLPGTETETQQLQLAGLIADRMNHTYKVSPPDAHFTVGKLVYLLGFDMLNHYPESIGYVELASRSGNMQEVKAAAAAIREGQDPEAVFGQYGITLPAAQPPMQAAVPEPEPSAGTYANLVGQAQNKIPQAARTPQDFAAMPENANPQLRM